MSSKCLEINLFGACVVRGTAGDGFEITGSKHRALFVLLATAPFGRRTRSYLQDTLWGETCYDNGRQSLRRALSDIKRIMGGQFQELLAVNNSEITLDLSKVCFIGRPGGGEFMEGIDIRDEGFEDWLRGIRINPEQVYSLYSLSSQPPAPAITPTVAILPFRLVHGDADKAILGDWLAEEICRSLSRSNLLTVISHLSAREISSRHLEMTSIRDVLGVDYCVHGSMRIVDDGVVLDADFLDSSSGRILWTRQFSGKLGDFLSEAGEAVNEIVRTVGRTIASEAVVHARGRSLADLEDHTLLVAGVGLMHQLKLSSFARSRELLEEAIRRSPKAAEAHGWLAEWYVMSVFNGWSTNQQRDTDMAIDSTARALDIDPENAFCLTIDGVVNNNLLQRLDVAEQRFETALQLNPNEAMSWLFSGVLHAYRDEAEQAVSLVNKAQRLSPLDPFGYFFDSLSSSAYLAANDFETALRLADRSLARNNRHLSTLRARICALHQMDRITEAREAGKELLKRQPDFTVDSYLENHPAAKFQFGKIHADALRAAGIP